MSGIMSMVLGAKTAIAAAVDAYFNLVTLLLPGDGTNGAQNNTFLDSSSNNFTITRNGNTTQGTFSPFSQTGWSNYFNGSSSLSIANNAVFQMGSGDFTIEFWANTASFGSQTYTPICGVWDTSAPSASTAAWYVAINAFNATSKLGFSYYISSATDVSFGTATNSVSSWDHYAVVRSGNLLYGFKNGTLLNAGGTAISGTLSNGSSTSLTIGDLPNGNKYNGYISNLRIVKGGALYTSSFTPSTTPLTTTVSAGTVSLLTCQDNRFKDNSTNAFALTVTGTPSVQAFSPFLPTVAYTPQTIGGSGYFDGTGDYLVLPASSAFDTGAGTSDVTFECWVYNNGFSGSQYGRGIFVFYKSTDYNNNRLMVRLDSGSNAINCFLVVNGATQFGTSGTNSTRLATPFAWTHLALVRSSQTFRLYINGVLDTTLAATTASLNGVDRFEVGRTQDGSVPDFNGNISGFRYLKGTAQYTSAFTPPTAPLTAIANTQLLLNFTNAGITDATAKNNLETVGNAQISTTQSKFGGSSMYFDGTGDYLVIPASSNLEFGTGDFTIEFWVYSNSISTFQTLMERRSSVAVRGLSISIYLSAIGVNIGDTNTSGWEVAISGSTLSSSVWYHVAITRSGSSVKLFVNGTQQGSTATFSGSMADETSNLRIGADASGSNGFNGYIDDLRITKGYARYTANFTAPTAAFALQ